MRPKQLPTSRAVWTQPRRDPNHLQKLRRCWPIMLDLGAPPRQRHRWPAAQEVGQQPALWWVLQEGWWRFSTAFQPPRGSCSSSRGLGDRIVRFRGGGICAARHSPASWRRDVVSNWTLAGARRVWNDPFGAATRVGGKLGTAMLKSRRRAEGASNCAWSSILGWPIRRYLRIRENRDDRIAVRPLKWGVSLAAEAPS